LLGGDGRYGQFAYSFNDRFQKAIVRLRQNYLDRDAWCELEMVWTDFHQAALNWGKVIVSERYIADHNKTIKPLCVGGVLGGIKYCYGGVFFKFAHPDGKLIVTEDGAIKCAGS
jgi:hypothetical protein